MHSGRALAHVAADMDDSHIMVQRWWRRSESSESRIARSVQCRPLAYRPGSLRIRRLGADPAARAGAPHNQPRDVGLNCRACAPSVRHNVGPQADEQRRTVLDQVRPAAPGPVPHSGEPADGQTRFKTRHDAMPLLASVKTPTSPLHPRSHRRLAASSRDVSRQSVGERNAGNARSKHEFLVSIARRASWIPR